jgi:hypothetical protein
MIVTNLKLVKKSVDNMGLRLDVSVRNARDEMMTAMIQLSQEEIKGQRPAGEKATAGQPPMNRTGNLRRSIRGEKFQEGFAKYSAIVGPTISYGRAVELGGEYAPPSWRGTTAMKGFPYMTPAYQKFVGSGLINQIYTKHLAGF